MMELDDEQALDFLEKHRPRMLEEIRQLRAAAR